MKKIRWDKADIIQYYHSTNEYLSEIPSELLWNSNHPTLDCKCCENKKTDALYHQIVNALRRASDKCCPTTNDNFYKPFWKDDLKNLKCQSIEVHNLWKNCGKPRHGEIYRERCRVRAAYRRSIRQHQREAQEKISNDLHELLLQKKGAAFWKTWNNKVSRKSTVPEAINGMTDSVEIARAFATSFENICKPNSEARNMEKQNEFLMRYAKYESSPFSHSVNVEVVDKCIRTLKPGKAAGVDHIESEHITNAHPRLCVLLSLLFNMILCHGKVPEDFCKGIIIPIPKEDLADHSRYENYRGITISSTISKLFEMCLLEIYGQFLVTSELQFGFKKKHSCSHALQVVRSVIDYFASAGSTVNFCALDLSKAFDKVNHYILFIKLMDRSVPRSFLDVVINWYTNCVAMVRWNGELSNMFRLLCGVRQGGVLSPVLFSVYVDSIISSLAADEHGCRVSGIFLGCIMYADDLLLMSSSLHRMQMMIDKCSSEIENLDMRINAKKSQVIRIGPAFRTPCSPLKVCGTEIEFVDKLKYLGVHLSAARKCKLGLHEMCCKFYRAFNSIYSRCHYLTEPALHHLMDSFCKPHLCYGTEAFDLKANDIRHLSYVLDCGLSKIYRIARNQVAEIYLFTDTADIHSEIVRRRRRFQESCKLSDNSIIQFLNLIRVTDVIPI